MEIVVCEEIYKICGYFKFHNNEMIYPQKNFTCLCELFKKKYICCKKGYSNLIQNIPHIVIYSPSPEVINSYHIQNSKDYSPNNKTILEVLTFAYEQKLEVLRYPDCVEGKHPYFNYGEK